jgi:hypothetical protein
MSAKEEVMNRMSNVLKGQAMYIKENTSLSTQDKCIQMDVALDIMRFLNDYDENCKVLNQHLAEKKKERSGFERE